MFRNHRNVLSAVILASSFLGACGGDEPSAPPPGPVAPPQMQPVAYWEKQSTAVSGDIEQAARQYVQTTPELTGRGGDWRVRNVSKDKGSRRHVRMHQLHEGVRVWGGDIVVHANNSKFESVKGNILKNLDGFDVAPTVGADAALQAAKGDYQRLVKFPSAKLDYSREKTELVIYPQQGRDARLAWRAVFFTELQAGVKPGLWNYFIDAKTGEIIGQFNAIHTLSQASGPGGNPKVARTWNMELDVEPQGTEFKMDTAKLRTFNMNQTTTTPTLVVGPLDPIGDAPINDAHGFAEQTLNMLDQWMGKNSIDNNGFVIVSRVHYDFQFENAFWDGTQMTYGDGLNTFHPLSGDIDVVAHEIAHGFTEFHSNLIYDDQSGGMNESFSDIAGTVAEFFDEGDAADVNLGADIFKAAGAALRFPCDPTADGISIDHFSDYSNAIDVHFSSGIMNKAFCLAAKRLASGSPTGDLNTASVQRVGTAFFEANSNHWVESSTFQQGCQGVMDATTVLGWTAQERDHLRNSWADVGVFCDGLVEPIICDETFTTDSGAVASPNFPNNYPNDFSRTYCIQPTSGTPVTLTFPTFDTEFDFDFVTVKDGVTGTVLSETSGSTAPPDATSTFIAIRFTTDSSVVDTGWQATWSTGAPNVDPTVEITAPADGSSVSGVVTVTANAADSDGLITKVTFFLPDGTSQDDTSAPYEVLWPSTSVADGPVTIRAKAFDNVGASAEDTVEVNVDNGIVCIDGTFNSTHAPVGIPDNFTNGITSTITVFNPGIIGTLSLSANISHTWRGDLRVILVSPTGERVTVHDRTGGAADNLVLTDVPLTAFNGITAAGPWTLRVVDTASGDVGTLNDWSLTIAGDCGPPGGFIGKAEPNLPTVNNGEVCSTLTVADAFADSSIVKLDLDGVHAFRSVLRSTLSHNGTTVTVFETGTFPNGSGTFGFTNRAVPGLTGTVNGDWTLCIQDVDGFGDIGTFISWSVHD